MSNEIINKVMIGELLTEKEVEFVIEFVAQTVKINLKNNSKEYDTNCDYCSKYLLELSSKMDFAYRGYETGELFMPELKHHFGFVGFRTENGPLWYIVDLSYKQFENKNYPITINGIRTTIQGPANKISKENKTNLINKGYIKLTDKNLVDYIDSFIKSYPKNIDYNYIYEILYEKMGNDKISIQLEDQFLKNDEEVNDNIKGVKL